MISERASDAWLSLGCFGVMVLFTTIHAPTPAAIACAEPLYERDGEIAVP